MSNYETYDALSVVHKDAISERFDSVDGTWRNYGAFDVENGTINNELVAQKHIDIRNFNPKSNRGFLTVFDLFQYTMDTMGLANLSVATTSGSTEATLSSADDLLPNATYRIFSSRIPSANKITFTTGNVPSTSIILSSSNGVTTGNSTATLALTVGNLNTVGVVGNENWLSSEKSVFSLTKVKNNFDGISLPFSASGTKTIQSISSPVNLSLLDSSGKIIITLPDFPGSSKINLNESYIDISSSADFTVEETQSINFANVSTSGTGGQDLFISLSSITKPDLSNIIGIRFRIKATASCTFKCLAIRAVDSSWRYSPVDIDTVDKRLRKTPPKYSSTGISNFSQNYILNQNTNLPLDWPVLQRAFGKGPNFSDSDPKILNGSFNTFIDIGNPAFTQSSSGSALTKNKFSIYYNIKPKTATQAELTNVKTQADLDALGSNPGFYHRQNDPSKQSTYSKIKSDLQRYIDVGRTDVLLTDVQKNPQSLPDQGGKTQNELNGLAQSNLNTLSNATVADYLIMSFNWYGSGLTATLSADLSSSATSITVTASTVPNNGTLLINDEQISYTSVTNNNDGTYTLNNITRAVNNTIAPKESIASGTSVYFDFVGVFEVADAAGLIYSFTLPKSIILMNSKVIFSSIVEEDYVAFKFYKIDKYNKAKLVYETDRIFNDLYFTKFKNRIGWYANLVDGDSFINSIRSGGLVYGEYRANTMKSRTPLKGLNLFADYSNDINLLQGISIKQNGPVTGLSRTLNVDSTAGISKDDRITGAGIVEGTRVSAVVNSTQLVLDQTANVVNATPIIINGRIRPYNKATFSTDTAKDSTYSSIKITVNENAKASGFITDPFSIEDRRDINISLNLWYPSVSSELKFILFDTNNTALFYLEPEYFLRDRWQLVKVHLNKDKFICGTYKFGIVQMSADQKTDWWINHLTVNKKLVSWEARSDVTNLSGHSSDGWIDLQNNVNRYSDGAYFEQKGTELQFRARAKSHYALIHNIKVIPNYATLGNFVWREE